MNKRRRMLDRVLERIMDDHKLSRYVARLTKKEIGRKRNGEDDELWYRANAAHYSALLREAAAMNDDPAGFKTDEEVEDRNFGFSTQMEPATRGNKQAQGGE